MEHPQSSMDITVADLRAMLEGRSHLPSRKRIQELITSLPKISETELKDLGHSESVCPICFNTFLAVLAEEEMALVMDSPAHPVEELGVTRLHETCGHIFCRRDITKWIQDGRESCPTCRRAFFANTANSDQRETDQSSLLEDFTESSMVARGSDGAGLLPILGVPSMAIGRHLFAQQRESRNEFSGMYS
ncbi:uncharacterized protein F5891DRAFT_363661 [Suillus fuscotomentosus]|uniref:RING-type domain-containing protein n=1 Tax=Suillus fuscotomentosus TaxID=1912939 RepID=A0AAD4ELL1_9AGAM|nr:uncharacterized protein F5891DRAFT_363661 [Suillus fuscotomentosus]KAG1907248.1 hypothetical protein F5891DRAFT_363661 [Suillus fuscotomentosus]